MNEYVKELNKWIKKLIDWMNKSMSQWLKEGNNVLMNKWMYEWINESEYINARLNDWMNAIMK